MQTLTIYHNPKCSKSRATLALLQEHGVEPRIVEYLKTPPRAAELKANPEKLHSAYLLRERRDAASSRGRRPRRAPPAFCRPANEHEGPGRSGRPGRAG